MNMMATTDFDIDYLAEVVFVSFFSENHFFPLFYPVLFGKMSLHAFTLKEWGVTL